MADPLFRVAVKGNLDRYLAELARAVPETRRKVIASVTRRTEKTAERQIERAGLGKLSRAVGSIVRQRRDGDVVGKVFSKAVLKHGTRPGGEVDVITVFEEGAVITARDAAGLFTRRTAAVSGLRRLGPRVRIRRRLRLRRLFARNAAGLDERIAKELERRAQRAATRLVS